MSQDTGPLKETPADAVRLPQGQAEAGERQVRMYQVFLSGPVDDVPDYVVLFAQAVVRVRANRPGAAVFNPAALPRDRDRRWLIARRLEALFESESVALLPGWAGCPLCSAEKSLADYLGLPVFEV
jgi:hypothetical protein